MNSCLHSISHLALRVQLGAFSAVLPALATGALLTAIDTRTAYAQCAPDTAGADVVCASDDPDGLLFPTRDFNSITIDEGVTVGTTATSSTIFVDRVATTVVNNGTVIADPGTLAMQIGSVPEFINSATGTIEGLAGVSIGDGVDTVLINRGTITGTGIQAVRLLGTANRTLINSGTLTGRGGVAVSMGSGDDIVELQPGSTINGVVNAGTGTDTLRFGGTGADSFNLNSIDAGSNVRLYRSFQRFEVAGGDWTFTGTTPLVFRQTGGTITGTGTFGSLALNGGVIAPGNSIGTITVNGDIAFNAGSTYRVDLNAAGQSDRIVAAGVGSIASTGTTLDIVGAPGSYPTTSPTYTILTANGLITGQFETITDNLPDLDFSAIYNATDVQLVYTKANGNNGGGGNGGTPALSPKEINAASLSGGAQAGQIFGTALRQRGGLAATGGLSGGTSEILSLGYMAGSITPEASPSRWAGWGIGLGSVTDVDASGGVAGWNAATGGAAFGIEGDATELFDLPSVFGAAFGLTTSDVDSGASRANIDSYHLGLYAASSAGPLTLSGAVSYAFQEYDIARVVPIRGGAVTARGDTKGYALTGSLEAFYDVAGHGADMDARFGPLATLDMVYAQRNGFTETGAGVLDLTVSGNDTSQLYTGLGVAGSLTRTIGDTLVTFNGRIAWQHLFGDRNATSTAVIPVAGATFVTDSAPVDRNRVALGLGTALDFSDTVSAHLRYDSAISASATEHRASAGLTIRF